MKLPITLLLFLTCGAFSACQSSPKTVNLGTAEFNSKSPATLDPKNLAEVPNARNDSDRSTTSEKSWCDAVRGNIQELKWRIEPCAGLNWVEAGKSIDGHSLMYAEFGNPKSTNVTLVFTMVHGDEVTPLFIGIELAHWLRDHVSAVGDTRVVLAPLVNPDSFFSRPRSRVNSRGVDLNRNLPTRDWSKEALKAWKARFASNPRRYPGSSAGSEPETTFQTQLIDHFKPTKILSVHAPLNFMDYDGPNQLSLARFPKEYVRECLKLRTHLKARSGGFFPGSLGNYAGQERGIPTLTLELPTANPRKARVYWNEFREGIQTMIEFKMPELSATRTDQTVSRQSVPVR